MTEDEATRARPDGDESGGGLRETYRQQLIAGIGGWSGALITAIPTTVFVIVNVATSLRVAIIAAVGSALVLTGYRLARKQSVQQALSGLFGVVIAALIAARTGQARGFFLLGIWTSFLYAVPFALSVLVRRPLVGLLWEFLDPTPGSDETPWHRRRPLLLAYTWATLAATAVFLARGIVQLTLYGQNATGWLAFARIAMGYPLFIAALAFSYWIVSRARRLLARSAGQHGLA
ncbi:MAG: hypothetical protein QOG01_130 [Pseudonocardiales bacterium]|jgi:hypothetical protein|nr:hypothetical protein [Pseudonocardiales bacterium]